MTADEIEREALAPRPQFCGGVVALLCCPKCVAAGEKFPCEAEAQESGLLSCRIHGVIES